MSWFKLHSRWWGLAILIFAVWLLPWWLSGGLLLAAAIFWPNFYWLIVPALLFDLSYAGSQVGPAQLSLPISTLVLIFMLMVGQVRYHLRI